MYMRLGGLDQLAFWLIWPPIGWCPCSSAHAPGTGPDEPDWGRPSGTSTWSRRRPCGENVITRKAALQIIPFTLSGRGSPSFVPSLDLGTRLVRYANGMKMQYQRCRVQTLNVRARTSADGGMMPWCIKLLHTLPWLSVVTGYHCSYVSVSCRENYWKLNCALFLWNYRHAVIHPLGWPVSRVQLCLRGK